MNSARSMRDAYLNCESPVPDYSLLYHRTPTLATQANPGGQIASASGGSRNAGANPRQIPASTPTASSIRSNTIGPTNNSHLMRTAHPVARVSRVLQRSNSLSTPPPPIRPTTSHPISGSRTESVPHGRRGTPIPSRRLPTTPAITVGPTAQPLTPTGRAALLRATINYLPTLSVATVRTVPPQPPPPQQLTRPRPNSAAAAATHPLHRVPPIPPPHVRLQRLMIASRGGQAPSVPSPPARARSVAAAMASSLQSAASRNVGSIYARAMIKLKTAVYKWRGAVAEAAEADTNCAICLDEMVEAALVRRLPCLHVFHKPCVDTWLQQNLNCPTCRRKLA